RRNRRGLRIGAEMSETPAVRASDAERERTVMLLREHAAEGRLTLEEFTDRMSAAYLSRTNDELAGLTRDLPPVDDPAPSRRRPQAGARERPAPATGNAARARPRPVVLRGHRRLARADRVDAEDVARGHQRHPLRQTQGARVLSRSLPKEKPAEGRAAPPSGT